MKNDIDVSAVEQKLDCFDAKARERAFEKLVKSPRADKSTNGFVNLHAHTFYSYNCNGYSPTRYAWLAHRAGLEVAGIVDFDVLDGLAEFHKAGAKLNLRTTVGLESRVHIPECKASVINSPGEPGIAYHMGNGLPSDRLNAELSRFLRRMKTTAQKRNRELVSRVNSFLKPVELDYDRDVLSLTPNGNATERHICLAYSRKAAELFQDASELCGWWCGKLGANDCNIDPPEGVRLQNLIRARTMKHGGPGYVKPDAGAFPKQSDMNSFVLRAGGIPTMAWLDGSSEAEQDLVKLMDIAASSGVAAINMIPDRNYTTGMRDARLMNLQKAVAIAEDRGFPISVGTEMNSHGQRFVDDLASPELGPLLPVFLKGARIIYAHTALQRAAGLGYLGPWAAKSFRNVKSKNEFFEEVGRRLDPAGEQVLVKLGEKSKPAEILNAIRE